MQIKLLINIPISDNNMAEKSKTESKLDGT